MRESAHELVNPVKTIVSTLLKQNVIYVVDVMRGMTMNEIIEKYKEEAN